MNVSMTILPKIIEDATSLYTAIEKDNFDQVDQRMQQLIENYKVFNRGGASALKEVQEQFKKNQFGISRFDENAIKVNLEKCKQQMMGILLRDIPDLQKRFDRQKRFIDACLNIDARLKNRFTAAEKILKEGAINIKTCIINSDGLSLIDYARAHDEALMEFLLRKGNFNIQDIKDSIHSYNPPNDVIINYMIGFECVKKIKHRLFKFLPLFIRIGFDINSELTKIETPEIQTKTMLGQAIAKMHDNEIITFLVYYGAGKEDDEELIKFAKKKKIRINLLELMFIRSTILKAMQKSKVQLPILDLPPDVRIFFVEQCRKEWSSRS